MSAAKHTPMAQVAEDFVFFLRKQEDESRWPVGTKLYAETPLIVAAPEQHELLDTFAEWARQVAAREDVPQGIRSAAAGLASDGRRLLAKATGSESAADAAQRRRAGLTVDANGMVRSHFKAAGSAS